MLLKSSNHELDLWNKHEYKLSWRFVKLDILNKNGEQILSVKYQTIVHSEENLELITWNSCAKLKVMNFLLHWISCDKFVLNVFKKEFKQLNVNQNYIKMEIWNIWYGTVAPQ